MEQLSHYNLDPRIGHLHIVKRVLYYLKDIIILGVEWGNHPADDKAGEKYGEMGVIGYTDGSYAGDIKDRKSITKYYFFLGGGIIIWYSKRQWTVLTSTSEVKYVTVNLGARKDM